jgi:hypothetical protein
MGIVKSLMGAKPKESNVAAEQAKLKASQDAAARDERDKAAASQANKENLANQAAAANNEQGARAAFMQGVVQDTEESRRKFLKKV